MNTPSEGDVLVAVGDDICRAALEFSVLEALRLGCGLRLLHVVRPVVRGPATPLVGTYDLEADGRRTLHGAEEHARNLAPAGLVISTELRIGGVVASIVATAESRTQAVVLEHRELSKFWRVVTRSVTSGVAARCSLPVISVPSGWERAERVRPTVTVGVDRPERSQEVLRQGIAEARRRSAVLRLLHVWSFPLDNEGAHGSLMEVEWNRRATSEMREALAATGVDLGGIEVLLEAQSGRAADALVEASGQSDLLVVGRHDPLVPFGSHLGPVARAVLREAAGPVLLANPRPIFGHNGGTQATHADP